MDAINALLHPSQHPELDPASLGALIELVREHTGIAMTARKGALLEGRIGPRMRALGMSGYAEYVAKVARGGAEVEHFVNLVTTNDTAFFRTPAVWDYLRGFLAQWSADPQRGVLRIWSAAAATGEECYSIAMSCEEHRLRHPGFRYQLVGTDISTEALATARAGIYGGRSVSRLREENPQLLERYFMPLAGARVQVLPELQAQLTLRPHNLLGPLAPATRFDLVFLRNVLIYFEADNAERVLAQVHRHMQPDARLLLGEQETIARYNSPFVFAQPHVYANANASAPVAA